MKYQVTVTEESSEAASHGCHAATLFQQSFEEMDVAALARFLNQPTMAENERPAPHGVLRTVPGSDPLISFSQDEPSSQGMPSD